MLESAGQPLECPNCAEPVQRTAVMCRFCKYGLSPAHFKKCPFCAEMVRQSAKMCRLCRSDLSEPPHASGEPPEGAPVPRNPIKPRRAASVSLALPTVNQEKGESSTPKSAPVDKPKGA
ncbi:MAG: hypothetical protein C5B53_07830 [Candidatus Melainabacteria bacterium]|nr:MAG: hypothetical protein C5B53_07830 [Candidatus Melainabacteria bacterium]